MCSTIYFVKDKQEVLTIAELEKKVCSEIATSEPLTQEDKACCLCQIDVDETLAAAGRVFHVENGDEYYVTD